MPADTQAVAMLQYSPSTSVVLLPFFCCYCCNGMHGMYLASYLVGHRGAHWFAVTVRVNSVFSEKNVVCIVNVGFTPLSFPFFSCGRAQTAMCDHFVCSCVSPEVVRVFPWISLSELSFATEVHWVSDSVHSVYLKSLHCVINVFSHDAELIWKKTRLEFTNLPPWHSSVIINSRDVVSYLLRIHSLKIEWHRCFYVFLLHLLYMWFTAISLGFRSPQVLSC